MKISKSTIVRLLSVLIVIVNLVLKALGKSPIEADEGTIASIVKHCLK